MTRLTSRSAEKTIKATRNRPWLTVELLEDRTMLDASALMVPDSFMIAMMEQASRTVASGPVTKSKGGVTVTTPSLGTYTSQWLVGIYPNTPVSNITGSLGIVSQGTADLLRDAYIFQFPGNDPAGDYQKLSGQRTLGNVAYFYPLLSRPLSTEFVPNDTLYTSQWHLNNTGQSGGVAGEDARLQGAWDVSQGLGATIAIVDNGVEYTHPDLAGNLWVNPGEIAGNGIDDDGNGFIDDTRGWDFVSNDNDPAPNLAADFHGTAIAGVAAAVGNNGLGVAGAAFRAKYVPIRLLAGESPVLPSDLLISQAVSYKLQNIDVANHSYGVNSNLYQPLMPLTQAAYQTAATTGRGGKGEVIVRSAGNNNTDINRDPLRNSRYIMSVGSVNDSGIKATNSSFGAPLIVVAPSSRGTAAVPNDTGSITTTDLTGANGYNGLADQNYTNRSGDTSTAAALVSGVVGLMLSKNPTLTYRDVQAILARTARRNNPTDTDWVQNGAGLWVNHKYGYGVVDATAAVNMASTWTNLTAEQVVTSGTLSPNLAIPDANTTGITVTATLPNSVPKIEWVEVEINIPNHTWIGDLNVELTAPSGTKSTLTTNNISDSADGLVRTFTTYRHLGEASGGTWSVKVWDSFSGDTGTLATWKLNVYGSSPLIGTSDTYTTPEDTQLLVPQPGVLSNDTGATSAQLVSTTTKGTLTFFANGSFRYVPNANYNNSIGGPDSFTYRPQNGATLGNLTTVTINITPVNDAPVANPDGFPSTLYIVKPGKTLSIPSRGVLLNDTDIDNNPSTLTAIQTSAAFRGNATLSSNGAVTYTPYATSSGQDFINYQAYDGALFSNTANVTFLVNSQPVSVNDQFFTIVGQGIGGSVIINDSDFDNNPMTAKLISSTSNGLLVLNANGTFTYSPTPGFFGIDTFTYRCDDQYYDASNPDQIGNVATVMIRVDRLPVANPDSFNIKQGSTLEIFSPGLLQNDTDADIGIFGDILQAQLVTNTTHGTLTFAANGYFKYTPNAGYSGPDSFTYRVTDGIFFGNTTTVSLNVLAIPVAKPDSYVGFGPILNVGSVTGLLANDISPNMNPLSAKVATGPSHGALTLNPDGSFSYAVSNGYTGVDQFTYVANDGIFDSDPTTVTLTLFAINQPPHANDDAYSTPVNTALLVPANGPLSNDTDPENNPLTTSLVSGPKNGSLLLNADGSMTYVPQPGFQGIDSFTYQASDGTSLSNVATVTITVGTVIVPQSPSRRIVMGQEAGGELKVFAGETGQALYSIRPYGSFTGAIRVATGDLNGDGVPDIITAAGPQAGNLPGLKVRVFNGVNGTPFANTLGTGISPFTTNYRGGMYVAVGDVNGDSVPDIILGAQSTPPAGQPWVRTVNGVNGVNFSAWYGAINPYAGSFGGVRVAAGDVNGDGRAEIITSPGSGTPNVRIYNPAAANVNVGLLKQFNAYTTNVAGGVFVSAGDLDGDGKAEVITGATANPNGQVRVFNGNTGAVIRSLTIAGTNGVARVALGDINGDGKLDLVVGITSANAVSKARVYDATTLLEMFVNEDKFNYGGGYNNALYPAAFSTVGGVANT